MYQYLLFDLDGTLTDSKEGIFNCIRHALDTLGTPVPPEQTLLKFIGPPLQDSFMEYCGFDREQAAEAVRIFRSRYSTLGKFENTAAPGMAELCARLKERGYILALASSKPEEMCVPICEKFGFAPSLAVIAGSPPTGDWEKADVIREAMRRLGLTEQDLPRVLMVGDRKFDVQGAAACGIACVGVEFFGYAAPGELDRRCSGRGAHTGGIGNVHSQPLNQKNPIKTGGPGESSPGRRFSAIWFGFISFWKRRFPPM